MSLWDDEAGYDRTSGRTTNASAKRPAMFDDDEGYELDDPKHSQWADLAADRADMERKRMKEDEHYAESLSELGGVPPRGGPKPTPGSESDEENS